MFLARFNFSIGLLQARGDQGHPDHIFYQGQVATFHDFPADRAKDLLQMAGSVTGKAPEKGFLQMAGSVTVKAPEKGVMTAVPEKAETSDEPSAAGAGMQPIARKLTLQRFLRKRKNR